MNNVFDEIELPALLDASYSLIFIEAVSDYN